MPVKTSRSYLTASVFALAVTMVCAPAMAQESNERVFQPEYFEKFQPQTADDMVSRLPGFSVQGNESGSRGFGQASLNLLINGRRPSSKSLDAEEILQRIPASNVVRIEILDGASLDIPGLAGQVANIVTGKTALTGSWEYAARFAEGTEPQVREGKFSLSGESGNLNFVASLQAGQFTFNETGTEQFFDGDGVLFEERTEAPYFSEDEPSASLNLTWTPKADHVVNFSASGSLENQRSGNRESFTAVTPAGATGQSEASGGEDEINYEISGDYSFPFLDGTLKLIGLYRFEESDNNALFLVNEDGEIPTATSFDQIDDEIEKIARMEYNFKPAKDHDLQLSFEAAFNILDSESVFRSTGIDPILDDVRVEEDRAETNLTHSWILSDKVSLQSSIGVEYSKIDVVTRDNPAEDYWRPKGFLSASYAPNKEYTWRAKVEREVGQLNFGDFVSDVSLTDDIQTAGNARIVPPQSWNLEVELERKNGKGLSGTLTSFVNFVEDPVDRILIETQSGDIIEGPGNLDDAIIYGVEASGTWILDSLGFKGARLEASGGLRESRIDDPVTDESRNINNTVSTFVSTTLRHDIPKTDYAWSAFAEYDTLTPFFRLDQSSDIRRDLPGVRFGVEHKDFFGMLLEVRLENILNWDIERERLIFSPDRAGNLIQRETFNRNRGRRLSIVLSDTF